MGWKNRISRFNGKMTKEKWLLLLLIGVLLMILSFSLPGGSKKDKNTGGQIAGAGTEAQERFRCGQRTIQTAAERTAALARAPPKTGWPRAGRKWGRRIRRPGRFLPGGGPHIRGRIL